MLLQLQGPSSKLRNITLLLAILSYTVIHAFPNGAGSCGSNGIVAVNGPHLSSSRNPTETTLNDAGISVLIDDEQLGTSGEVFQVEAGVDHSIIVSASNADFRGFLIRVEQTDGGDATGAILPQSNTDSLVQEASFVCFSPVAGVTHTFPADKSSIAALLRFDESVGLVTIDVTIVFENNPLASTFAFDQFEIDVVDGDNRSSEMPVLLVPTPAPVDTTPAPTQQPTVAPSVRPTKALATATPTINPTSSPTATPVTAPATTAPTESPTSTPTKAPVRSTRTPVVPTPAPLAPTKSPVTAVPTEIPTSAPSATPVMTPTTIAPTGIPTSTPTKAPERLTRAPVVATPAPVAPTKSPATSEPVTATPTEIPTSAPTASPVTSPTTNAPTEHPASTPTKAPVRQTRAPVAKTPSPVARTTSPIRATSAPSVQPPVNDTMVPTVSSDATSAPTFIPRCIEVPITEFPTSAQFITSNNTTANITTVAPMATPFSMNTTNTSSNSTTFTPAPNAANVATSAPTATNITAPMTILKCFPGTAEPSSSPTNETNAPTTLAPTFPPSFALPIPTASPSRCTVFPVNTLYQINHAKSGLALGVAGNDVSSGANIVLNYPSLVDDNTTNDKWQLLPSSDDGYSRVISQLSSLAVGVGSSKGDFALQKKVSDDNTNDWCFVDFGDGTHFLENRRSGLVLAGEGQSATPGATRVRQWPRNGNANQRWVIIPLDISVPTVAPTPVPATTNLIDIARFVLINSKTTKVVQLVKQGENLISSNMMYRPKNIVAVTVGPVEYVEFLVDNRRMRRENIAPYAAGGDFQGEFFYLKGLQEVGEHSIIATPFTEDGIPGTTVTLHYTVSM